jgi:hypothetical protein
MKLAVSESLNSCARESRENFSAVSATLSKEKVIGTVHMADGMST